jgi:uncharacterized Zn-finger protein
VLQAKERHVKNTHYEEIKCEFCEKTFSKQGFKNTHIKRDHPDEKPFPCDRCDYRGKTLILLRSHIQFVHSKIEKPFKCDKCPNSYTCSAHLQIHISAVHDKLKPYKCDDCNYETGWPDRLTIPRKLFI